jgi:hypothetical protein
MASLEKAINKNLFDSILPTFGNQRVNIPAWDNGQKMFLCNEYESANGNRYYCGVRFCDRIAIVEKVGLYHNWTYIDGIELYAFNGSNMVLIQKRDYEKEFRNESFIREESIDMVKDYLSAVFKSKKMIANMDEIESQSKMLVANCYKSFLDGDFNTRLTQIVALIENKR